MKFNVIIFLQRRHSIMEDKKESTKILIKQAAIRQIEKVGLTKTSMRSIAAEAEMTTGAIYYYYKNKQDLFDEIIKDSIHFTHRMFDEYKTDNITGSALLSDIEKEARLRLLRIQEEKLHILLLADAMNNDSNYRKMCTENLKSVISHAALLLAPAFEIEDSNTSEQFASIFMATLDGVAIQQLLHSLPVEEDIYIDTLIDFFKESIPAYISKHKK